MTKLLLREVGDFRSQCGGAVEALDLPRFALGFGHESELVSRQYTHVDDETKRKAIRNLPVFGI